MAQDATSQRNIDRDKSTDNAYSRNLRGAVLGMDSDRRFMRYVGEEGVRRQQEGMRRTADLEDAAQQGRDAAEDFIRRVKRTSYRASSRADRPRSSGRN